MTEEAARHSGARAALDGIVRSRGFRNSPSLTRFLRYIVEETLEGRATGLKETILGETVFDRGAGFDPRLDPIVRVQAAKLRTRLKEYYEDDGAAEPWVIDLPKGRYAPQFTRRSTARRPRWPFGVAAASIVLVACVWMLRGGARPAPHPEASLTRMTYRQGSTTFPAVSRDGRFLAFASDQGSTHYSIWLQQMSGGTPVQLTRDDGDDRTPDISPDSRMFVYRSNRDGGGLYIAPIDGGPSRKLTQYGWLPRFSPDGNWISCIGGRPGTPRTLDLIPVAGGLPTQISVGSVAVASAPVWSPDGQRLVFLGSEDPASSGLLTYDWYSVAVTGGTPRRLGLTEALAAAGLGAVDPAAAPCDWRESSIVFSLKRESTVSLLLAHLNAPATKIEGPAQAVSTGAAMQTFPRFGAQPGEVVFSGEEMESHAYSIALDDATGVAKGGPVRLTEDAFPDPDRLYPTLLADGAHVGYARSAMGGFELVIRNLASGAEQVLVRSAQWFSRPAFPRDAASVLYLDRNDGPTRLVRAGDKPEWRPCANCGDLEHVSSDERWILLKDRSHSALLLMDWSTGALTEWLRYPTLTVSRAEFSPDGRWVAVTVEGSSGFVVPFDAGRAAPRSSWIPVVEDAALYPLSWSADGARIYYFSRIDGRRCLWSRTIGKTGQAAGDAFSVAHFHDNQSAPWSSWLSLGPGRAAFVLTSLKANIWLAHAKTSK